MPAMGRAAVSNILSVIDRLGQYWHLIWDAHWSRRAIAIPPDSPKHFGSEGHDVLPVGHEARWKREEKKVHHFSQRHLAEASVARQWETATCRLTARTR